MSPKTISTPLLALLAAGGLAACGSSKAPGVQPVPSSGATQAAVTSAPTTATTTSTSSSSTPTASTPKSPSPLSKKPAVAVPSGAAPTKLVVKDLIKGTGPAAKSGSQLTVNYVGMLYKGGTEFDSSWKRNQPFPFQLGQGAVIKGWDQGLVGMKVGGRRELIIPPDLAYGKAGSPPTIPPNSTLVFVVDLLGAS
jgi:FKBP-type peptidyl-prolyl cis-trans isomerase